MVFGGAWQVHRSEDRSAGLFDDSIELLALCLVRKLRLRLCMHSLVTVYLMWRTTDLLEEIKGIWSTRVGGLVRMDD